MPRETVTAPDAPRAIGPYSHAASAPPGELLFLSGQTPLDPATGALIAGDVTAQTERVFANLELVLRAASRTFDDVVKVTVYLTRMSDFAAMNEVYQSVFAEPYPARTTVAVAGLPRDAAVEIEVVVSR